MEIVKTEDELRNVPLVPASEGEDPQGWNNAVLVKDAEDNYFVVSTAPAVPGLEDIFPANTIVVPSDENGWVDIQTTEPVYDQDNASREDALTWLTEHHAEQEHSAA